MRIIQTNCWKRCVIFEIWFLLVKIHSLKVTFKVVTNVYQRNIHLNKRVALNQTNHIYDSTLQNNACLAHIPLFSWVCLAKRSPLTTSSHLYHTWIWHLSQILVIQNPFQFNDNNQNWCIFLFLFRVCLFVFGVRFN